MNDTLRTISELVADLAAAMAGWPDPANGQVRALPDQRTLRWYGTIGLLDKPLSWRGRTALYGRRHRLQVLAVKRLQAAGWPIVRIQERLLGTDDATLATVAGDATLPPIATAAAEAQADAPAPRARAAFWAAPVAAGSARMHLDLGGGAEVVLPPDAAGRPGLDAALAPLRAWLATHHQTTPETTP